MTRVYPRPFMRKILIVDDDDTLRKTLQTVFTLKGYQVVEAGNGRTAVEMARKELPDIVVSDIDLPGADGIEVLKTLRADSRTAHIPIILITGRAQTQEREGMETGADDFIVKPFPVAALLRSVEARLHEHSAVEKVAERKLSDLRRQIGTMLPREFDAPLSEILVYSDVLKTCADDMDAGQVREMAEAIDSRAHHLERAMKSFILYAQLESAAGNPQEVSIMRSRFTEDVMPVVAHAARQKAVAANRADDLDLNLHKGRAEIASDLLGSMIEELVDNAFKFSTTGEAVDLQSRDVGNFIELKISDHGCGMESDPAIATDAYVQLRSGANSTDGLGLGLAIAKRIVEIHGGSLDIQSALDQGTTVTIKLPARLQELRAQMGDVR